MAYLSMPDAERFWSRLDKQDDGCWIWRGAIRYYGYGVLGWKGKLTAAHRLAWLLAHPDESLTPKNVIGHTCDVPPCCNPAHLYKTTKAGNQADMARKGRSARGERNGTAVLTDNLVREARLRYAAGESLRSLAGTFDVNYNTLRKAVGGRSWRHIGVTIYLAKLGALFGSLKVFLGRGRPLPGRDKRLSTTRRLDATCRSLSASARRDCGTPSALAELGAGARRPRYGDPGRASQSGRAVADAPVPHHRFAVRSTPRSAAHDDTVRLWPTTIPLST